MPELDSLRGLAVLLVVLHHGLVPASGVPLSAHSRMVFAAARYGIVGVDLFFVLSGFLITGILIDSRDRPDYFRRFYSRRALRILPVLFATLILVLLAGAITWPFFVMSALLLANLAPLLGLPIQYTVLWSLAVEEHFYVLWPAIIRRFSPRTLMVLSATIVAAVPFLRILAFRPGAHPTDFTHHCTWLNLDGLALGGLLAMWVRRPTFRRAELSRLAFPMLAIGSAMFVTVQLYDGFRVALTPFACNIAFAGLLSCALLIGTSRWKSLVNRPVLSFLGFISYGLYLLHVIGYKIAEAVCVPYTEALAKNGYTMCASLLPFAVGSVLGISVAYLSRRWFEAKFLAIRLNSVSPSTQHGGYALSSE